MSQPKTHTSEHSVAVHAPADVVYGLIADVTGWPRLFAPTVHAERVDADGNEERIRLWATANGEVKTWTSRRGLDPVGRRITFRQEVSQPPVAAMGGTWAVNAVSGRSCEVVLTHDYRAVDDDPAGLEWIERACDRNSRAELAALKTAAEARGGTAELARSFEDTVLIRGSAGEVYDFINRSDLWPRRLPHVSRVELREDVPGLQLMAMDTRAPDGSVHTTESVRVCFPDRRIVYKQTRVPALLSAHTGQWRFREVPEGVEATSQHAVVIAPDRIGEVLGAEATVAEALATVEKALSTNSRATLHLAKEHVEGRGNG